MNNIIKDLLHSERTVEAIFIAESLLKYCNNTSIILDVGGIPTDAKYNKQITDVLNNNNWDYRISDFRGGTYVGDFVKYDFNTQLFDIIIFLSSLEHFPQCTEGDLVYRKNEDIKGFKKALNLLKPNGVILLTVPCGKQVWQPYHQNYDKAGIAALTNGSILIESYTYRLIGDTWIMESLDTMGDILYTDKAYGVGCFILKKEN